MIWFKKKDPVCGMKQEENKGKENYGHWFCSDKCMKTYEKGLNKMKNHKPGCCH